MTREFSFTSNVKLQFRMEAFNFTNTPHLEIPDNDIGDGEDFMTITGVRTSRGKASTSGSSGSVSASSSRRAAA